MPSSDFKIKIVDKDSIKIVDYSKLADQENSVKSGIELPKKKENVKWPAPSVVLLVNWADLSPQLTADLMFLDASNHPEPSKFDVWAKGGDCPYRATNVERMAWFYEKNELWGQGRQDTILNLMNRILSEKCPKWTDEQTASFEAKFKK
jgi:hypothetical protein